MLETVVIANDATIRVGDAVAISDTGCVTPATAGDRIFGIVQGLVDASGLGIRPDGYAPGVPTSLDTQTITVAADNETVGVKKAIVETSQKKRWSAEVNGVIGTTNASDKLGAMMDVDTDNGRLLESTADRTGGTQGFFVWGVDQQDATRVIVSIYLSALES